MAKLIKKIKIAFAAFAIVLGLTWTPATIGYFASPYSWIYTNATPKRQYAISASELTFGKFTNPAKIELIVDTPKTDLLSFVRESTTPNTPSYFYLAELASAGVAALVGLVVAGGLMALVGVELTLPTTIHNPFSH